MQSSFASGARLAPEPTIDVPRLHDIPRLVELTKRLSATAGLHAFRCPQTESDWRLLIEAEDIVCARMKDGRLAGFYAANQFDLVDYEKDRPQVRAAHNVLCNRYKLQNNKVSFGAQAVVDLSPQHTNLRGQLLRELLRRVGLRFRYLFTEVQKANAVELQALTNEGWRCFHEEDEACYMMLDVAKALRSLASSLILQSPPKSPTNLGFGV